MKRRIFVFDSIALVVAGCRQRESSELGEATPLINGLMSHQSASEVEEVLRRAGIPTVVLEKEESEQERPRLRSALSVRVLSAAEYQHLGVRGDLRLEFVDDQLAATWFFPHDVQRFDAEMKKRGLTVQPGVPVRMHGATELRAAMDFRGRHYWAWEDINLRARVENWIKKNA